MDMGIDMDMVDIIDLMDMDTGEERRGMLMLWQLPLLMRTQMLILGTHTVMVLDIMDMGIDMDMVDIIDLMDMDTGEERRGMLMLRQLQLLMRTQMLILGTHTDTVLDIMDMGIDMDMVDIIDLINMDTGEERKEMLMQ